MDAKSQVRKIEFMGYKTMPYRMKHQEEYHHSGRYEDFNNNTCAFIITVVASGTLYFMAVQRLESLLKNS